MRRIMIARRNNLRDHAILKRARAQTGQDEKPVKPKIDEAETVPPPKKKQRGNTYAMTDEEVIREMDVPSVEGTRSFKTWLRLEPGQTFTYNQTYVKGKEGHEWLLKKNIWRRMRYRRENKKMVDKLRGAVSEPTTESMGGESQIDHHIPVPDSTMSSVAAAAAASVATHIVDHTLPTALLAESEVSTLNETSEDNLHDDVVEAAVAAAESYVARARESETAELTVSVESVQNVVENSTAISVHNPIMNVNASAPADQIGDDLADHHHTPNPLVGFDGDALDVAAKLAAAASVQVEQTNETEEEFTAV